MKEKLLKWLDELAENQKEAVRLQDFYMHKTDTEPLFKTDIKDFQVHLCCCNITELCGILGIHPECRSWKNGNSTAEYTYFYHNDVEFFSLVNLRENESPAAPDQQNSPTEERQYEQ